MKEAENFKAGAPKGSCWLEDGESPMKRNGWNRRPESDPWPIARKVTGPTTYNSIEFFQ